MSLAQKMVLAFGLAASVAALNGCSVGMVTASSKHQPGAPVAQLGRGPASNSPGSVKQETALDRDVADRGGRGGGALHAGLGLGGADCAHCRTR
jgi:hypothetical protein